MTGQVVSHSEGRAIEATAKATQTAIEKLAGLGNYLENVFGTVPADLVGILGGDWLKVRRAENLFKIIQKARARLEAAGIKPEEPASLSLVLPIAAAAADESRDELQEIWAALLAAAADPAGAGRFRNQFIEIAKAMDPLDAAVLKVYSVAAKDLGSIHGVERGQSQLMSQLQATRDQVLVSIDNLVRLGILQHPSMGMPTVQVRALGREFMRAVLVEKERL